MNRGFLVFVAGLIAVTLTVVSMDARAHPSDYTHARVISASRHDVSPPLRDMRWNVPAVVRRITRDESLSRQRLRELAHKLEETARFISPGSPAAIFRLAGPGGPSSSARVQDPDLQRGLAPGSPSERDIVSGISFDGLGYSTGIAILQYQPDTSMAVGMKYVVEAVNATPEAHTISALNASASFAVYDKSDGSLVMGPVDLHTLWSNFPGGCAGSIFDNTVFMGPQVVYDQLAHRWIISIGFGGASSDAPSAYCVAISKTNDPTGEYYRYQFDVFPEQSVLRPSGARLGVWPDAYYAAFNLFDYPGGDFNGVGFVAIDRNALLHGLDAQIVEIQVRPTPEMQAFSVLPATLEGFTPPPKGTPGLFANYMSPNLVSGAPYALYLWKMRVNWARPSDAMLEGPYAITLPPFNDRLCGSAPACIPQPPPGDALQSVSDRLMYPLVYRNFGDRGVLTVSHTVGSNPRSRTGLPSGIRWYEFDTSASGTGGWGLVQSGTYAPADGANRWMGSMAMDRMGDMALGYSVASQSLFPSVAFTGRLVDDPEGTMTQGETVLVRGGGSQFGTNNRWGNYSSMVPDPADDCTFWYAQEYYTVTGAGLWSTRIGAFKFDSCVPEPEGMLTGTVTDAANGGPLSGVTLSLEPGDIQTRTDQEGHYRIEIPAGTYSLTATMYPYAITTVSTTVSDDNTTTKDIVLPAAKTFTLSGHVTDGSGHGYGLPALIDIATSDLGHVATATAQAGKGGSYSIELASGFEYVLAVHALMEGYEPASSRLTLTAGTIRNFALRAETACTAPGYAFASGGFGEDFNSGWLPAGWTVANEITGSPVVWNNMEYWDDENYTGGSGDTATVDSNKAQVKFGYHGPFDSSLVTPPLSVSSLPAAPILDYKANFWNFMGDALDLDISVDGGSWTTILHWKKRYGGLYSLPGRKVRLSLDGYIPPDAGSIRLRWRYFAPQVPSGLTDWYAQIDDVVIGRCAPLPGGLVVGRITDANTGEGIVGAVVGDDKGTQTQTLTSQPGVPAGTYALFASSGQRTLTASAPHYASGHAALAMENNAIATRDFALDAGRLIPKPDGLALHAKINVDTPEQLVISNPGAVPAHFHLLPLNAPPSGSATGSADLFAPRPSYGADTNLAALSAGANGASHHSDRRVPAPVPASANPVAGDVLSAFPGAFPLYGLGVDRYVGALWLGSPAYGGLGGDNQDHQVLFDGAVTGNSMNVANESVLFMADMAWDGNTGTLWQLSVDAPRGEKSHIYELDPKTMKPTGLSIEVPSFQSERGLAYDPLSDSWYAGDFNSGVIYHFDSTGQVLDSADVKLPIIGLAYNSATGHLFVLTSNGVHDVYILDTRNQYAPVGMFDIPDFDTAGVGAGFGSDCGGHLWLADTADQRVIEVASGETGWCAYRGIPWLTMTPASGTIAAGESATVTLDLNGAGHAGFTVSRVQLLLTGDTPYPARPVPLTVTWDAQPVALAVTGSASSYTVQKGSNLVYTLNVENKKVTGHGTATETTLDYTLPAGTSYVSGSGEGVTCGAPTAERAVCDLGTLDQGASKTMTIAVRANKAGKLTSHFEVTARESDDSGENTLDLTTTVVGNADLGSSAENSTLTQGGTGTLHLAVTNAGPDPATDVKLKLSAGANVKLQSANSGQGSCTVSGGGIECDLGEIAAEGQVAVTVTAFGITAGSAQVTAQATTTADDANAGNNVATAQITVEATGTGGGDNNGGGGGFGWFALAALFGIALAGFAGRRLKSGSAPMDDECVKNGETMAVSDHAKRGWLPALFVGLILAGLVGFGIAAAPGAWAKTAGQAKTGLRAGLAPAGIALAQAEAAAVSKIVVLAPQSVPILLQKARLIGPHDASSTLSLTVSLKLRNVAQLRQFLREVQNPASPAYRDFLTPDEFTARYGPSLKQVSDVVKYLKRFGIRATNVSPNHVLIHTEGSALAYERAFGIGINDYILQGRHFFSTPDKPRLPRAVGSLVQNIIGLANAARMQPLHRSEPLALPRERVTVNAPPPASSGYYNPMQIARAYEWPDITDANNGAAVTIAILTAASSNLSDDDYNDFWSGYGLPGHDVDIIPVDGDQGMTSGTTETLLDMEWSGAMSPGAALDVYVGSDPALATFIDMYNQFVTDNNAQVMSTSWGAPETVWGDLAKTTDEIFMQAAAQGISMFAAAGDHGAADNSGEDNAADYPSVSLYVASANGTTLYADKSGDYISETAWDNTGGAVSRLFDQPDWQIGPGVPDSGWRMNSDLAMNAGPDRLYVMRAGGQWIGVYGTSAVAPQLAGLFAIGVSQQAGNASLGQSNSLLYDDVNAGNYGADFRDVTTGCNGKLPDGNSSCAKADWDHPTGWGSPRGSSLLSHLGTPVPAGTLKGTVTDVADGTPLAHAVVTVSPGGYHRETHDEGTYSMRLPVGDYTLTVTAYGYEESSATVSIADGDTATRDFALTAAPRATVSGTVSDGSGHGYGLYAAVKVTTADFGQVAEAWTKPATGQYSVELPMGSEYTLKVVPALNGYDAASASLTLTGDTTKNFALTVGSACTAPGYAYGFAEDFNGAWPPTGWTAANDVRGSLVMWNSLEYWGEPNYIGSTGNAATADAFTAGTRDHYYGPFDTSLITPPIPTASLDLGGLQLTFMTSYIAPGGGGGRALSGDVVGHAPRPPAGDDMPLDVDVSVDGGPWVTALHWQGGIHGQPFSPPGVNVQVPLGRFVPPDAKSFRLRWHYYRQSISTTGSYAQIDNVRVGNCDLVPGGLAFGQVTDANTGNGVVGAKVGDDQGDSVKTLVNSDDPNLPIGAYLLFVPDGKHTLTASFRKYADATASVTMNVNGFVTQDMALKAGRMNLDPTALSVHAVVNGHTEKRLEVENSGGAAAGFRIMPINVPPASSSLRRSGMFAAVPEYGENAGLAAPRACGEKACPKSEVPHGKTMRNRAGTTHEPGDVVSTFRANTLIYGLAVDRRAHDLWLGGLSLTGADPFAKDYRFLFDGTKTGDTMDVAFPGVSYMADGAFDALTGKLWQLSIDLPSGATSHIYELNPETMQPTGRSIPVPSPQSERGLAYDPASNTWFAGDFNSQTVYHFDASGTLLDSTNLGLNIIGLAYNPASGHLFVLTSNGEHGVYVFDVRRQYKPLGWFDIEGFDPSEANAGFGYSCDGHLRASRYHYTDVFEFLSGETDWCDYTPIPWVTLAPANSTVNAGASVSVTLDFNGDGHQPFTTSRAQLKFIGDTPYPVQTVPLTVYWDPQPVDLALTGEASPAPVRKGSHLAYTLTVENTAEADHGAATETRLTYELPPGTIYVSASGEGASCTAPTGTAPAPAVATNVAGMVSCDFGTLAQGDSRTVTIAVKAERAGKLTSHFEVSAREPDDSGKNTLDVSTTVIGTADLGIGAEAATLTAGSGGTLHLTVSNAGPDPATEVKVKLGAGANVRLQSAASAQGTCAPAGAEIECDLGEIAAGGEADVKVEVFGISVGSTQLTAQATTTADDAESGNNVATAQVTVEATGDGGSGGGDGGGGGALGWLGLAALLALAFAGLGLRYRRRA